MGGWSVYPRECSLPHQHWCVEQSLLSHEAEWNVPLSIAIITYRRMPINFDISSSIVSSLLDKSKSSEWNKIGSFEYASFTRANYRYLHWNVTAGIFCSLRLRVRPIISLCILLRRNCLKATACFYCYTQTPPSERVPSICGIPWNDASARSRSSFPYLLAKLLLILLLRHRSYQRERSYYGIAS